MKNKTTKNSSDSVKIAVIGASLAGLAASAYFFFGPKGKQNQKHAKAWAVKMKGDVMEKLENAKEVSEPVYSEIIDSISKEYKKSKKASQTEIDELAKDLKKHWKTISSGAKVAKKDITKDVKKVIKVAKK